MPQAGSQCACVRRCGLESSVLTPNPWTRLLLHFLRRNPTSKSDWSRKVWNTVQYRSIQESSCAQRSFMVIQCCCKLTLAYTVGVSRNCSFILSETKPRHIMQYLSFHFISLTKALVLAEASCFYILYLSLSTQCNVFIFMPLSVNVFLFLLLHRFFPTNFLLHIIIKSTKFSFCVCFCMFLFLYDKYLCMTLIKITDVHTNDGCPVLLAH